MKILVINWQDINNPMGGGAEVHLHEIFKRIVAMGHKVTLFCSKFDGAGSTEVIDGINVIRKGSRNFFNFWVPWMYFSRFRKEKYDIIIDDINKIPFYTPLYVRKVPLLAISHHFFGKSIFHQAGRIFGSYVYLSEKLVNLVYKKTRFAVVSESTKNEFVERGFNPQHFAIITNAIAQESYPMKVRRKNDFLTVCYFGRLKKYKSVDHLFRAFAVVSEKLDNAMLFIIGRGDFQPELEKLSSELGIKDKVVFYGFVTDAEKIRILSSSHIVINTSMKEGWGITNIEANACGTPVVSADVPGLRDSVRVGLSGELYEYGNIKQLAAKIYEVLVNNDYREILSEGAVKWAKTFSWDLSAKEMIELCKQVIMDSDRK